MKFRILCLGGNVYSIVDAGRTNFYVVVGNDLAAVIDTGISPGECIVPIIREITDKPLILLLTHAHVDHLFHMDEFDRVFLCHRELEMTDDVLAFSTGGRTREQLALTTDIRTGTMIDIGGNRIEVCEAPGHTPGSVVFLEQNGQYLFTGDALGSGNGAWLQVSSAVSLVEYSRGLKHLLGWLMERNAQMKFRCGHSSEQHHSSLLTGYNPVSMGLLLDMIDLVDGIISHEISGSPAPEEIAMTSEPPRYAHYGRAEIYYTASHIGAEDWRQQ